MNFTWTLKSRWSISKTCSQKKEKLSSMKHFIWLKTFIKITISNFIGRWLKRKTMLVWVKECINKNFASCKGLCNLRELYTAFKEKHPNLNIGMSKFRALRTIWYVLVDSKMTQSVCVCSTHQNVVLLVGAMDWDLIYKDLIYLTLSCFKNFH